MKGNVYCDQRCRECDKPLKYVDRRSMMACPDHPNETWEGRCRVQLGKKHIKRFRSVFDAENHLIEIRLQYRRGKFDVRDHQKNAPLSFLTLRENFILSKQKDCISPKQIRHITYVLEKAGQGWDRLSIKDIAEGEIEDFFDKKHGVGNKTLANWKTVLHDFWTWVVRREKRKSQIEMPEFPDIKFKMKMKKVVTMDDQAAIFDELDRITRNENPRIWLGIRLMGWYPRVRPGEMLDVQEGHINLSENWILFPDPKEGIAKYIVLLPEHVAVIKEIREMSPKALPGMPFFRHLKTKSGVKAGVKFGPKYFNIWWKKACQNLGIEGVSVYPGVKHSTVTALGQFMSPEEIQQYVTGHASASFKRYFLPGTDQVVFASRKIADMQKVKK